MARQYAVPGLGDFNETGSSRQYGAPGVAGDLNEGGSAPPPASAAIALARRLRDADAVPPEELWRPRRLFAPLAVVAPVPARRRTPLLEEASEEYRQPPRRFAPPLGGAPPAPLPRRPALWRLFGDADEPAAEPWLPRRLRPPHIPGGQGWQVDQVAREILLRDGLAAEVSQLVREALVADTATPKQVLQVAREVLLQDLIAVEVGQVVREILLKPLPVVGPGTLPKFPPTPPGAAQPLFTAWPVKKRAQFQVTIQRAVAGRELRGLEQSLPVWTWTLQFPVLRDDNDTRGEAPYPGYAELRTLLGFFCARLGADGLFLYDDPTDDKVTAGLIAIGDGATRIFQLGRWMDQFFEPLYAIDTVSAVYLDGAPQPTSSYWIDDNLGLLTFAAAPGAGVTVTTDFTYWFVCRFTDDLQDFENLMLDIWQLGTCKIQSVLPPF